MITFVLSEIYGVTPELIALCRQLPGQVIPLSPYEDDKLIFDDEQQAYQYFVTHVGVEGYSDKLRAAIDGYSCDGEARSVNLIGFSVGASAVWHYGLNNPPDSIANATLFYGSQIRKLSGEAPIFPCKLVMPSYEEHFDVTALAEQLAKFSNVVVENSVYLHGFMNKRSANYNEQGFRYYLALLTRYAL